MPIRDLRRRSADRPAAVGAWLAIPSTYAAETVAACDFDVITVDLQHGMFGIDGALELIAVLRAGGALTFARSPDHDPATIGKLLDGGAQGIICPTVDSAEQAEAFVRACRYPPSGIRSYGAARAPLYGVADEVITLAMVESRPALDAVDDILAVPGLDGIFVGPNDLALSLGEQPGGSPGPAVRTAMQQIADAARRAERLAGVFAGDVPTARWCISLGFQLVVPGTDAALLRAGASARIADVLSARSTVVEPGGGSSY